MPTSQFAVTKTVLLIGVGVAFLATFLFTCSAFAEQSLEQQFRARVVQRMHWEPRQGIKLTTTDFARKHANSYPTPDSDSKPQCRGLSKIASSDGIVLFQTKHLDIFVYRSLDKHKNLPRQSYGLDGKLRVYQRGIPCARMLSQITGLDSWTGQVDPHDKRYLAFRFEEATGAKPLELIGLKLTGTHSLAGQAIALYRLNEADLEKILSEAFVRDWGGPPHLGRLAGGGPSDGKVGIVPATKRVDGTFEFYFRPVLMLRRGGGNQPADEKPPLVRQVCQPVSPSDKFRCKNHIERRAELTNVQQFLESAFGWHLNVLNIRFVLENRQMLEENGYVITDSFVDRLKRHLPE